MLAPQSSSNQIKNRSNILQEICSLRIRTLFPFSFYSDDEADLIMVAWPPSRSTSFGIIGLYACWSTASPEGNVIGTAWRWPSLCEKSCWCNWVLTAKSYLSSSGYFKKKERRGDRVVYVLIGVLDLVAPIFSIGNNWKQICPR